VRRSRFATHLSCELGPTVGSGAALDEALESIRAAARRLDAVYVRLEPVGKVTEHELARGGCEPMPVGASVRHRMTSIVDLTLDESDLWSRMKKGHRRAVQAAQRRNVRCREGTSDADIEHFLRMVHETEARARFRAPRDEYFRLMIPTLSRSGSGSLYLAEVEGEPVAGSIVLKLGLTWYGAYAAAHRGSKAKGDAGVALDWHVLLLGKASGATRFDFWGVSPPDRDPDSWAAFSRYKRAFGGSDVARVGTWVMPIRRCRYLGAKAAWRMRTHAAPTLKSLKRTVRHFSRRARRGLLLIM
jgi:lipid II:glycine glycyltransferase (peptidoglycan interpeptide bridge formation enzyme)